MIIWLASYPRSGNTLLRTIFRKVFEQHTWSRHDDVNDIGADARLAEEIGHRPLGSAWPIAYARMRLTGELHLVKTHDGPEDDGKAICIVRDGRPACRSFYHYLKDFPSLETEFSLADVIAGFTPFGSWGEHLDRWDPLRRPETLLLKYENLIANPADEIQRIAAFTGLTPLHEWRNPFQKLHEMNPRFFRAGSNADPAAALNTEEAAIFWNQHGDWMRRLDYPVPDQMVADVSRSYRRLISDKGREYFNLRERVFIAERQMVESIPLAEHRNVLQQVQNDLAAERLGSDLRQREQHAQLSILKGQLSATQAIRAELQGRLDEASRSAGAMQKQSAIFLQEKNRTIEFLAAAAVELNTRLRMLLTSRLLHLGWKIGFGRTPYWAEPSRDEVTPILQMLKLRPGSKSVTTDSLRRASDLANRAIPGGGDMGAALQHLLDKGFKPNVVLDVGSAKGYWSVIAALRWPEAEFFMIDPLRQSEPALRKICLDPRFHYQLVAVGKEPGEAVMNVTADPDGSSLLEFANPDPAARQTVAVDTLDRLLSAGKIKPPQLVKLDVQGFELHALDGGSKLFDSAEVFIIEANLFEFMPGCPRLDELVKYMAHRGFHVFDFAGFLRRPFENDLGQLDIVFVRQTSPMVATNRWMEIDEPVETGTEPGMSPFSPIPEKVAIPEKSTDPVVVNAVSVIICTKDPRMPILDRALDSLDRQTLARHRFELIVVDNNSSPPLDLSTLQGNRAVRLRLIAEPEAGLSQARCAGIAAARGDLLVFVDDDNFLSPDYLELSVAIARAEPRIGLFGGISVAEHESPIPKWKQAVLPYLGVRDYGPEPITAFADHWGEWEPIGAGMAARREVAEQFVEMHRASSDARQLGRRGEALLSGEDSLFARAAHRIGYSCSYQPSLQLVHFIRSSRMNVRYLARLMQGHGRSYVLLHRALGKPTDPLKMRTAAARLIHRLQTAGRAGAITWFWDLGYAAEKRNEPRSIPLMPASKAPAGPTVRQMDGAGHGV